MVVPIDLMTVHAARTAPSVSPSDWDEATFPILSADHFDTGSTFTFSLPLATEAPGGLVDIWAQPVKMKHEVWDLDYINEILEYNDGLSFAYALPLTAGHNVLGTCKVRFYFDDNCSGDSVTGPNDPCKDSPSFEVKTKRTHSLVFARNQSQAFTAAQAGTLCTGATNPLLMKDFALDRRAICQLAMSGTTVATIAPDGHDPVKYYQDTKESADADYFFEALPAHDVAAVTGIDVYDNDVDKNVIGTAAGCASDGGAIIVTAAAPAVTLAHELGHVEGLADDKTNAATYIMVSNGSPARTGLTNTQAAAYE